MRLVDTVFYVTTRYLSNPIFWLNWVFVAKYTHSFLGECFCDSIIKGSWLSTSILIGCMAMEYGNLTYVDHGEMLFKWTLSLSLPSFHLFLSMAYDIVLASRYGNENCVSSSEMYRYCGSIAQKHSFVGII